MAGFVVFPDNKSNRPVLIQNLAKDHLFSAVVLTEFKESVLPLKYPVPQKDGKSTKLVCSQL